MTLETVTLKLPRKLLSDAGSVAAAQDVTVGHLVRQLLAKEVDRRLGFDRPDGTDGGLVAALQVLFAGDMANTEDWDEFARRLSVHGYALRQSGDGLDVVKISCNTRICKASELGPPYLAMISRIGEGMPDDAAARCNAALRHLNSTVKGRLQRSLGPVFKSSNDWKTLLARLQKRGYVLRPQGTGCAIYELETNRHVCNTATVGYRYRALVKKMGGAMPGHSHGGDWIKPSPDEDTTEFEVIEHETPFWRAG